MEQVEPGNLWSLENALSVVKILDTGRVSARSRSKVLLLAIGGQRLADRLLQVRPRMKVLFMSGYTEQVVLQHGQFSQAVAFVQKPFTYAALACKVREVLASL